MRCLILLSVLPALCAPVLAGGTTVRNAEGIITAKGTDDRPDPTGRPFRPPKITTKPGTLVYIPCPGSFGQIRVEGREHFKKPAPSSGTVSPNAVVVDVRRGPLRFALAFDSKDPKSHHLDLVRLDFTGKGDFRNAPVVARQSMGVDYELKEVQYRFAEQPLEVKVGSTPMSVTFVCRYREREAPKGRTPMRTVLIDLGTQAQGACRFGQKVHNVRLKDANGNLCVSDGAKPATVANRPPDATSGDAVHVDLSNGRFKHYIGGYYGHPVVVDGRLYHVVVSSDGTRVTAKPFTGKAGMVRINQPAWKAKLIGDKVIPALHGGAEPVPVPAGRYRIHTYCEWGSADWKRQRPAVYLIGYRRGIGREPVINVAAGQVVEVTIGSPIKATLSAELEGNIARLHIYYTDVAGRRGLYFNVPGNLHYRPHHTVTIFDASGKGVAKLDWKWRHVQWEAEWKVPPDLKGTFKASLADIAGPFRIQSRDVTFAVGGR